MKVKLKTIEQLEKEFRPYASIWDSKNGELRFEVHGFKWHINSYMLTKLGTFIDVKNKEIIRIRSYRKNYTHEGYDGWVYHELWFEPEFEDFLSEEEFML
jgi:hypothetical protein